MNEEQCNGCPSLTEKDSGSYCKECGTTIADIDECLMEEKQMTARECAKELERIICYTDEATTMDDVVTIIEKHMAKREARLVEALRGWSKYREVYIQSLNDYGRMESRAAEIALDELGDAEKQLEQALTKHKESE